MGKLMKDVPATRYSLLDRPTPELRKAELLRNFAEDAHSYTEQRRIKSPFVPVVSRPYRSTAEELEAYLQSAYRR
jgi:hypothetical protein